MSNIASPILMVTLSVNLNYLLLTHIKKTFNHEYVMSTTAILLKFPIFNCEVHSVNKILSKLPQCIIGNPHADCSLKTSNIDDSLSTSRCNQPALPQYNVNNTPNSRTTERFFKLIQHDTTPWKPKRYQNSSSKIIFF